MNLSKKEKNAWVAGLLEGEGCFRINENYPRITCEMTDEDTIRRLHKIIGKGSILYNKPRIIQSYQNIKKRKPTWCWGVSSANDVLDISNKIIPYMSDRRQQKIQEIRELASQILERRKERKNNVICRKCGIKLHKKNQHPSRIKRGERICLKCLYTYEHHYHETVRKPKKRVNANES